MQRYADSIMKIVTKKVIRFVAQLEGNWKPRIRDRRCFKSSRTEKIKLYLFDPCNQSNIKLVEHFQRNLLKIMVVKQYYIK